MQPPTTTSAAAVRTPVLAAPPGRDLLTGTGLHCQWYPDSLERRYKCTLSLSVLILSRLLAMPDDSQKKPQLPQ